MKLINQLIVVAMLGGFFLNANSIFAQGSLTPPGAPAPTMKTADQIEPRTILNAANTPGDGQNLFTITNPGSYYLTTNLVGVSGKNGIKINTNNVTLDLNGFSLLGVPGSGKGITIYSYADVTVRNGSVSGWADYAIDGSSLNKNTFFERLSVDRNKYGIYVAAAIVRDCEVSYNTNIGIEVLSGTVSGCYVAYNGQTGIRLSSGAVKVNHNTCIGNNTANDSSSAGIYITAGHNFIEDNLVVDNYNAGIWANSGSANVIIKNNVSNYGIGGAGVNYSFNSSQVVGPLITTTASGIITTSTPWANFSLSF